VVGPLLGWIAWLVIGVAPWARRSRAPSPLKCRALTGPVGRPCARTARSRGRCPWTRPVLNRGSAVREPRGPVEPAGGAAVPSWLAAPPGCGDCTAVAGPAPSARRFCSRPRPAPSSASIPRQRSCSTPRNPFPRPAGGLPSGLGEGAAGRCRLVDAVVSGLVPNFVPDPAAARGEVRRVTRPGGLVAASVWDYAEGMRPIRLFPDAAGRRRRRRDGPHRPRVGRPRSLLLVAQLELTGSR
jgi:hypothetical protein